MFTNIAPPKLNILRRYLTWEESVETHLSHDALGFHEKLRRRTQSPNFIQQVLLLFSEENSSHSRIIRKIPKISFLARMKKIFLDFLQSTSQIIFRSLLPTYLVTRSSLNWSTTGSWSTIGTFTLLETSVQNFKLPAQSARLWLFLVVIVILLLFLVQ